MLAGSSLAFLLDIDGTLVFTDELYYQVFVKLLTPHGHKVMDIWLRVKLTSQVRYS